MLWIDLDESLLVHVYAGKLEVKPAAEELLVVWPILEWLAPVAQWITV